VKCDWLRLKLYFPSADIEDIEAQIRRVFGEVRCKLQFQKVTPSARTPSNDFRDERTFGTSGATANRIVTRRNHVIEFSDVGVRFEVSPAEQRVIVDFRGRFWTLASQPWAVVNNMVSYFADLDENFAVEVSRIDLARHFEGEPLSILPNPPADNLFFSFLDDESKPSVTSGNIILRRNNGSNGVVLYNKSRQVLGEDQDIQHAFAEFLKANGLPPAAIVTRSELRIGGRSQSLRLSTQLFLKKKLGLQASLVRVLKTWANNHMVRVAPQRAKSFDKSRDYKRKKWARWQPWYTIMCLSAKPLTTKRGLKASEAARIPIVRPARQKDNWKDRLKISLQAALVHGQTKECIEEAMAEVYEPAVRNAARELVERDMAKRILCALKPEASRRAGETPEWLARLLVPQAPKDYGSSVSRHPSPFPKDQNRKKQPKASKRLLLEKRVLNARKAAWKEPFNKLAVSLYRDSLFELISVVQLGLDSAHSK
jgi:hypothetical protein